MEENETQKYLAMCKNHTKKKIKSKLELSVAHVWWSVGSMIQM